MAVLFARLREVASPILRKGGDSDARGTRLPATGPVAWTYSGRRVRLIHHLRSQNRRLHAEGGRADVNRTDRRAFLSRSLSLLFAYWGLALGLTRRHEMMPLVWGRARAAGVFPTKTVDS